MQLPSALLGLTLKTENNPLQKNSFSFIQWIFLALKLESFLYFLKRKLFLHFRKWNSVLFSPSYNNDNNNNNNNNNQNIYPQEDLLCSNIKKILTFSQKKVFLIFEETETPKFFLYFENQKTNLYYINLYFMKGKFLIFKETETLKKILYFRK